MNKAYIRFSTDKQDGARQRHIINEWCQQNKVFIDEWIEVGISSRADKKQRRLDEINSLRPGDAFIVSELSRLGRGGIVEQAKLIELMVDKKIRFVCIRENIDVKEGMDADTEFQLAVFSYVNRKERDSISLNTKQALQARVAAGVKLGRPKGEGKSRLDKYKKRVLDLHCSGISFSAISKLLKNDYNVDITPPAISNFIKKQK